MATTDTMHAPPQGGTHAGQIPVSAKHSRAAQQDLADRQNREQRIYTIFAATLMVAMITFGILGQLGVIRV
jgi:hypothetical protein